SSVLGAGVVPAFADACVITPGTEPLSALPAADGPLVVDQFEELFTQCEDQAHRTEFIDRVVGWPYPVAIGLRADFYGACATYAGLAAAVAEHQVLLGPMTSAELRRAIVEPAARAGLRLEPGLVDVLVGDVVGRTRGPAPPS